MKRGGPLRRSKPLLPGAKSRLRSGKPIRPRSAKRDAQMREYKIGKALFLAANPWCACGCGRASVDVHHMAGRVGADLLDTRWWLALARVCHDEVTVNPAWALERGLSVKRLGKRPRKDAA